MSLLRTASTLAAVAATVFVAACGSNSDSGQPANAQPKDAYSYDYGTQPKKQDAAPPAGAITIKAAKGALGTMLADTQGRSLYLWEGDQGTRSACDDACAQAWPPLTGKATAGAGVDAKLLGTAKRADGSLSVTYAGHPLYYFAGDTKAGETNGQGLDGFGAEWYVVSPAGAAIEG